MDTLNDRQQKLLNYVRTGMVAVGRDYPGYKALANRGLVEMDTISGTRVVSITPKGYDTLVALKKAEELAAEVAAHHERMDAIERVLTERKAVAEKHMTRQEIVDSLTAQGIRFDALADTCDLRTLLDKLGRVEADILPMIAGCTFGQWLEQVNAVALQATALHDMKIPHGQRHAAVKRLVENAKTLAAWTADDRS